jgi:hypothetical protein
LQPGIYCNFFVPAVIKWHGKFKITSAPEVKAVFWSQSCTKEAKCQKRSGNAPRLRQLTKLQGGRGWFWQHCCYKGPFQILRHSK